MNQRTKILNDQYQPVTALMIYESKVMGGSSYYLESHPIDDAGRVLAGKPLQQEDLDAIVDVFFDERKNNSDVKGLIPENLLSFDLKPGGKYSMVWYRPSEIRVIHHAAQLKLPTAKCWVPAMIYATDGHGLDVYALKKDCRPAEKTKICKAPFFNVSDAGDVCLGNAKVKKPAVKTYSNLMKYWEDLFWLSEFTHTNGENMVKSKNLTAVWKKLLASKAKLKWDAIDELIETKKTLNDIL